MGILAKSTFTHNGNINTGVSYIKRVSLIAISVFERLLCLDVRKMMLSPISQSVIRPLYNGGSTVLHGAQHHLLSMLLDTPLHLHMSNICIFVNFNSICL